MDLQENREIITKENNKTEKGTVLLSAIILCYNEKKNIEKCIRSVLGQSLNPEQFEVLIVDGMSDDGTREIIRPYLKKTAPIVRLIDNKKRVTPSAMNLGIKNAKGDYVSILGGHTVYGPDYLKNSLELFSKGDDIVCTGGPIVSKGQTTFGKAVAVAMSHPFGVGNATHRFPNYEGYGEGACFPTFKKEVFDHIGLYDEKMSRNQDDELNFRLKKGGFKVYLSPTVKCVYYVRDSWRKLFKQYYQYGFWRVAVLRKHKMVANLRQLVPTLFYLYLISAVILFFILPSPFNYISTIPACLYFFMLAISGITSSIKNGIWAGIYTPIAIATMHAAYGFGFLIGLFNRKN